MADQKRGYFENNIGPDATPIFTDRESELRRRLQLASCALLLELAHADAEFSEAERSHIEDVIRKQFGLDADGAKQLLAVSEAERSRGAQLHEFAELVRASFDAVEKSRLLAQLWRLALSDGHIAQREAYLMQRIGELLGLTPDDVARARGEVEADRPR